MPKKIAPSYYFIGNHSVLDFINTKIAVSGNPFDLLTDLSDLLEWLVKAHFLIEGEANEYSRKWGRRVPNQQGYHWWGMRKPRDIFRLLNI